MGQDTTEGDGGADEGVELLVTADGELEMAGGDALDLEVLCGVLQSHMVSSAADKQRERGRALPGEDRRSRDE